MTTSSNPGAAFGKYHVIAELGRGGMAKVYLAVVRGPAGFSKLLVLKQLRANLSSDADFLAMFLDEARLAARLNHANIVQTNEVGQTADSYFMAMEFLDGQPLVNLMKRAAKEMGGLPLPVALRIVADVCAGLSYAHTLKDFGGEPLHVVHRDISPQNIFITYGGQVKVVDFGIAKATSQSVETQTGVLKGKVAYMPPEQVQGKTEVDHRADIFAIGVVLFEALTTTRLWGMPDVDIIRELLSGRVLRSPKVRRADLPEEVDKIAQRALAPERDDRYASALDMQRDLERAITNLPTRATSHEIGELMTKLFAKERVEISAVIQKQIQTLEKDGEEFVAASIPNLTIGGGLTMTPSGQATRAEGSRAAASRARKEKSKRARVAGVVAFALALCGVAVWIGVSRMGGTTVTTGTQTPSTSTTVAATVTTSATASGSASASVSASASAARPASAADASAAKPIARPWVPPQWAPPPTTAIPTTTSNPLGDRK